MFQFRKFRTPRARKRAHTRIVLSSVLVCATGVILLGFFCYGITRPSVRIAQVTISGNEAISEEAVRSVVADHLSGRVLGVLPQDTVLTLRTERIEDLLRTKFPRAREITVTRYQFTKLAVLIREREPKALWCGDVVPPVAYDQSMRGEGSEAVWGTCYLMDEDSFIYAAAPVYTGDIYLRYYGSLERAEPIGQYLLNKGSLDALLYLKMVLQQADLPVRALLLLDEQDMELYLTNGLRLIVRRDTNAESLAARVGAILAAPETKDRATIEYLDLRFGNRAYIRYEHMTESEEQEVEAD